MCIFDVVEHYGNRNLDIGVIYIDEDKQKMVHVYMAAYPHIVFL